MKEVTEWNGKPRHMWVWDGDEKLKSKGYVLCILTEGEMLEIGTGYPVRTIEASCYLHCAEIEEETMKAIRLTNYEVSQLLKCFGVECRNVNGGFICNDVVYELEGKEVSRDCKIRYKQGEWEEPTRETVFKWWGKQTDETDISRFIAFIGWDVDKEQKQSDK